MKELRIVFMGTPAFAVESLRKLTLSHHTVVGTITAPDRPAGRGRKLQQSAVKQFALEANIPVLQPTNLKDDLFIEALTALQADLFVVVAFRMLPERVWQLPPYGTFNLHASLLPQYRGAAPINWALIHGETETGVTTFFIDEKIDTGAIIFQEKIAIDPEETAGSLHDKLMVLGSALVLKTVNTISKGTVETSIQPKATDLKTAYKLNQDNTKIDWKASAETIINLIRGLNPYPAAWCYLEHEKDKERIKIYDAYFSEEYHEEETGTLFVDKKTIKIAVPTGVIYVREIQLPGKRKMTTTALLNGYLFPEKSKIG